MAALLTNEIGRSMFLKVKEGQQTSKVKLYQQTSK